MDQYPMRPRDPEFAEELLDGPERFMTHVELEEFLSYAGTRKQRKAMKARRKEREQARKQRGARRHIDDTPAGSRDP